MVLKGEGENDGKGEQEGDETQGSLEALELLT